MLVFSLKTSETLEISFHPAYHHNVFLVLSPHQLSKHCNRELHDLRRWWVVDSGSTVMCRKSIPRILWLLPKLTYTKGFGIKVSNIWLHKHDSHYKNISQGVSCWLFKQNMFNYEHLGNKTAMAGVLCTMLPPMLESIAQNPPLTSKFHVISPLSSYFIELCFLIST